MKNSFALGVACLLLPMAIGCTHQQIRAQNPEPAAQPATVQAACIGQNTHYIGDPNGCPSCPQGQGYCPQGQGYCPQGQGYCPQGGYCPDGCPDGACKDGCLQGLCKHNHHHWYTYDAPQDLVYPPQNSPAAVVQYPYYTLRGPTDFFMK